MSIASEIKEIRQKCFLPVRTGWYGGCVKMDTVGGYRLTIGRGGTDAPIVQTRKSLQGTTISPHFSQVLLLSGIISAMRILRRIRRFCIPKGVFIGNVEKGTAGGLPSCPEAGAVMAVHTVQAKG